MTPRAIDIAQRVARGQTVRQIANDLGVSRAAVYGMIQRHHIPLPGYRPKPPKHLDPHAPRPDWSHPSPELRHLAHTIRAEILAAWGTNA